MTYASELLRSAIDALFAICVFPRRIRPAVEERSRCALEAVARREGYLTEARVAEVVMNVAIGAERDMRRGCLERTVKYGKLEEKAS